jgi:hypothetical protein
VVVARSVVVVVAVTRGDSRCVLCDGRQMEG